MFLFTGPVLLLLSTVFEWIMGNFFSMMVHGMFAVFWLSIGVLQLPTWGLAAAYSKSGSAAEGAASVEFNAAIALYLTVWGFALFTFFIFTLRLNIVFCLIFGIGSTAVWTYSAAFWRVAAHNYDAALKLQKVSSRSPRWGNN
jgi:succinate-acetate transporter protein